jgi:hypothetical protein
MASTRMSTKLIELQDGTLVEVEVPESEAEPAAGSSADKVNEAIGVIKPILVKVCHPIFEAWQEINTKMPVEQAEVEINFGFTVEGSVYITKLQSNSNLKVKVTLKPKNNG